MANRWWRKERWSERHFAPSAAEGGRWDQGAVEARWVWRELVGQAMDPGSRGFSDRCARFRGRSYARNGQVLSIEIDKGRVTAKVQGSRPKPYDITMEVKTLSAGDWSKVVDALGRQALFAAKLLAGEMPQDIEPVFAEVGLSLFPAQASGSEDGVFVPGLVEPLQAHRGGVLLAWRRI